MGGQSNVHAHKVNDLFLFTSIVYKGWVCGQKIQGPVHLAIEWPLRNFDYWDPNTFKRTILSWKKQSNNF